MTEEAKPPRNRFGDHKTLIQNSRISKSSLELVLFIATRRKKKEKKKKRYCILNVWAPPRMKMTRPRVWSAEGCREWALGDSALMAQLLRAGSPLYLVCSHPQNTPVGTPIFIVNATDPDLGAGGSVLYSFQPPSQFFAIDSARGIVTVIRELDYETTQAYQLTVNATVSLHAGAPAVPAASSHPGREQWGIPMRH